MTSGRDGRRADEPLRRERAALSSDAPQQADRGATVAYTCECCGLTKQYDRTIFEMLQRTRVARGLPFHIQDPVVLTQIATLVAPSLKAREQP
jgi:hypothetical protein